jgi:hypothetical protein
MERLARFAILEQSSLPMLYTTGWSPSRAVLTQGHAVAHHPHESVMFLATGPTAGTPAGL